MAKHTFRWEKAGFIATVLNEDLPRRAKPRRRGPKVEVVESDHDGNVSSGERKSPVAKGVRQCRRGDKPDFDPTVVAESYEKGETLHGLAKKYQVGIGRIYKAVFEFGGSVRKVGRRSVRQEKPGVPTDAVRVVVGNGLRAIVQPQTPVVETQPEPLVEVSVQPTTRKAAGGYRGSAESSYLRWLAQQSAQEPAE